MPTPLCDVSTVPADEGPAALLSLTNANGTRLCHDAGPPMVNCSLHSH